MPRYFDLDKDGIRNRMLGCWLGQMSGDTLGSMVEFDTAAHLFRQWPEGLKDMAGSDVWGTAPGQVTDDTEMAIELLRALGKPRGAVDWDKVAQGYVRWYRSHPFDVGRTTRRAISAVQDRNNAAQQMRDSANVESKANGALMRQSALAIWGYAEDPRLLGQWAQDDARLTHPNPVCLEASAVYVATLGQSIRWGLTPEMAYEFALDYQHQYGKEADVLQCLEQAYEQKPPYSSHIGYVLLALHNAFYQLIHTESLEEAVVHSVMLGGDTDTNAAIAGALAGAIYGEQEVPTRWVSTLMTCQFSHRSRPSRYLPKEAYGRAVELKQLVEEDFEPILNDDLTLADVPPPGGPWELYRMFAYLYPWPDEWNYRDEFLRADTVLKHWANEGELPRDLETLRKTLFRIQRIIRHAEETILIQEDDRLLQCARAIIVEIRSILTERAPRSSAE